jgi:hypothetical protein
MPDQPAASRYEAAGRAVYAYLSQAPGAVAVFQAQPEIVTEIEGARAALSASYRQARELWSEGFPDRAADAMLDVARRTLQLDASLLARAASLPLLQRWTSSGAIASARAALTEALGSSSPAPSSSSSSGAGILIAIVVAAVAIGMAKKRGAR